MDDVVVSGITHRGWHIQVTPVPTVGHFYVITEPGKEPSGKLPGLPFETLDECVNAAKQIIDEEIERNGGVAP